MELTPDLKSEVKEHIDPILTGEGFDLVEIKLARYKQKYRLQIFVDSDRGVNLDDCAHLSRLVGAALDVTDLFARGYVLEISSPGIDRPLRTFKDFSRRIGQDIKIEFENDGKTERLKGALTDVNETELTIDTEKGGKKIALDKIILGKVII